MNWNLIFIGIGILAAIILGVAGYNDYKAMGRYLKGDGRRLDESTARNLLSNGRKGFA